MKGFKQWYTRMVKKEYASFSYKELKTLYFSELHNTGSIEIPGYMTKSNHAEIFYR